MSEAANSWRAVCVVKDIDQDHTPSGFYATDGICTHENACLPDGMVLGEIIECPRHQGRFHIPSGQAKGTPACIDLQTYPTKIEADQVLVSLPE